MLAIGLGVFAQDCFEPAPEDQSADQSLRCDQAPVQPAKQSRPLDFSKAAWNRPAEFTVSSSRTRFYWDKPIQFGNAEGELLIDCKGKRCVYWSASNENSRVTAWCWESHEDPAIKGKRSEIVIESPVEPVVTRKEGKWIVTIPAEK